MATTRPKSPKGTSQPAEIKITVVGFQNVLANGPASTCRDTNYAIKLLKKHPRVYLKKGEIHVRYPGANLRFTVTSRREDKENYFPAGITFVREGDRNSSDEQRLGLLNFPQRKTQVLEKTVSITDTYRDRDEPVRYKFSLVIQRGSDGTIGIIDPGIVHDSSDLRSH